MLRRDKKGREERRGRRGRRRGGWRESEDRARKKREGDTQVIIVSMQALRSDFTGLMSLTISLQLRVPKSPAESWCRNTHTVRASDVQRCTHPKNLVNVRLD
jgi:hypothetical protein